jgi:hypothetical protein
MAAPFKKRAGTLSAYRDQQFQVSWGGCFLICFNFLAKLGLVLAGFATGARGKIA